MRNLAAAFLATAAFGAMAGEPVLAPVTVWTEKGRISADRSGGSIVVEGGARAEFSGISLWADSLVAWQETKELYVEGGVRLVWGVHVVEASRAVLRLGSGEAFLWEARLLTSGVDAAETPVHLDADLMRITFSRSVPEGEGVTRDEVRILAQDGVISACRFAIHDLSLTAGRMTVRLWKDRPLPGREDILDSEEAYDGGVARTGFSAWRVLGFPVLPFPPFVMDLKDPWLKSFEYGSRRRFGTYVRTLWGQNWSYRRSRALREMGLRKLQFRFNADHYQVRGWGLGPQLDYKGPDFRGHFEYYGIEDEGDENEDLTGERFDGTPNRWRLRFTHAHDLGDGWSALLEIHRMSDSNFRKQFFEAEERSGRPIENRLWIQKVMPHSTFWITERIRNNAFLTETEYLPQAGYQVFSYPLEGSPFLYSSRSEVAYLRRNNADPAGSRGDSYSTSRADTEQRVSWPFGTGPVSWEPSAGFRETAYQRNRARVERAVSPPLSEDRGSDSPLTREAFVYGCSASSEFFRVYDAESELMDIDRLRHNVIPGAVLTGVRGVTEKPKDVPQFDAVDTVTSRETVDLSVRHLFLTKRGPARQTATFADVDWRSTWFPDPNRDNPVTLPGGRTAARDFSSFRQDATVFPGHAVTVRSDTVYDPYGGSVDAQTTGMSLRAGRIVRGADSAGRYLFSADLDRTDRDWGGDSGHGGDLLSESGVGLAIEHRQRRNLDTVGSLALQVQFTERWGADYQVSREIEPGQRWKNRRFTVHRRIHDGALEIFYEIDNDTGEYRYQFNFTTYGF